ncbi:MAG TPA: TolC family protein [Spirochaetota bacterium]|nr:TolC family protein [Spirochaetota bacterium]HOS32674.1 TolC family protein [Spirochaetota bacterium]HOS56341.1 TolC family protein [Spirochaetota bacterium]HQF78300.1 TolC family protein [Spirochaetota bacterium]HQH29337.1 TolC family protein [Spirochaetota bacterium]
MLRAVVVFVNIFFIASNFFSQDGNILYLSLEEAINLSVKNNLDIKKEDINLKDKKIALYSSFNKFYPDLSLSSSINSGYDFNKETADNSIRAGFSLSLSLSAKIIYDIRDLYLDYYIGKVAYDKIRASALKNLKLAYFNIVLIDEEINIKEKALKNAEARYNKSLIQYKEGEISELDILNEEYSYKSILPDLVAMKNNRENVVNLFKIILGIPLESSIALTDVIPTDISLEIPDLDNNLIENNLIENNFDIQNLNLKIEKDKNSQYINIASLTPSVRLSYSVNTGSIKDPFIERWNNENWSGSTSLGFTVSIPIKPALPFSSEQVSLIKSDSVIKKTIIDLEIEKNNKRVELTTILLKLKQVGETLEALRLNIDIAEKISKLTENSYYEGTKSFLEVAESQKNAEEAKLKYNKSLYDYYKGVVEIEFLLNESIIK